MTRNDAIEEATIQYINSLNPTSLPTPKQAQDDLLELTQDMVELGSAAISNKARKWEMPKKLTPRQVAELMLALDHVVRLSFIDGDSRSDYDAIAIYMDDGPFKGTYSVSPDDIHARAALYDYNVTSRDLVEIDAVLSRNAKLMHICQDRNLIVVGNGIFDFDKKTLMPFTPDLCFLSKSHVDYVPSAVSPVIHNGSDGTDWEVEEWIRELSDDEGVPELLWEIIGAVIRPNVSWNKSAWFYSETGNNGKGTLCELMRNICGDSYASLSVADMGKDFMLEQVIGKSAIITDENDVGTYIDKAANLKALITGDAIMINRKFKKAITYRFKGFMVQCLNELPKIRDRSDSIYRRQLFVPFKKCYTGAERKYIKDDYLKRDDVLEYVLKRVLEMDYYQLSEPVACKETLSEYKVYNDPVKQFADDIFPRLAWDGVPFGFLYALYLAWMKQNIPGSSVLGRHAFTLNVIQELANWPEWICKDRSTSMRTGNKMDAFEPLIQEFDLKDWQDGTYHGADPMKKYRPMMIPATYKGITRAYSTAGQADDGGTDSESEDE